MSRLALGAMAVVLLLGSLAVTSCALFGKKETVVTINEVPASVKVAIDKVTAGSTIKSIENLAAKLLMKLST
jgi:hypothetical protein